MCWPAVGRVYKGVSERERGREGERERERERVKEREREEATPRPYTILGTRTLMQRT